MEGGGEGVGVFNPHFLAPPSTLHFINIYSKLVSLSSLAGSCIARSQFIILLIILIHSSPSFSYLISQSLSFSVSFISFTSVVVKTTSSLLSLSSPPPEISPLISSSPVSSHPPVIPHPSFIPCFPLA